MRGPRLAAISVMAVAAWSAGARAASLEAALDREAVAPGEPFVFEVTLTVADESVEDYRPPDFHGLEVLSAPRFPNRSTNMQIAGGQTSVTNSYTWSYQLALPSGAKGPLSIGAAHLKVGGREMASNVVQVRVGTASGRPQRTPAAGPGGLFRQFFGGPSRPPIDDDGAAAVSSSPSAAFIRVVPDKTHAFVGEQVTVAWYLYLSTDQNKYETLSESHTDGFWSEEIPSTNPQGRLSFTAENQGGRTYNVALLFKKALFPLAPGKLTITPMEAQVAQVDFFGTPVRARRIKTEPVVIEAQPLPREGEPPGFETSNIGRYEISATVDRAAVAVGDAVTLKIVVKGTGNVRNVRPPALPPLAGWKSYEPKVDVAVTAADDVISGSKTVEWLLRPERPGKTIVPSFVMETFDPAAKRYRQARTKPFDLMVSGEGGSRATAGSASPAPAGVENVIAGTIRPIRVRSHPSGEMGVAFLRGAGLPATLAAPPLALALLSLFGRVRERLGRDSLRTRRRRARSLARRRLRAAETHRAAGRAGAFYVEIDRVLREALAERLGTGVGGLRLDELAPLLAARGVPADDAAGIIRALEAADEARFAPGGERADPAVLSAVLARADELLGAIDKAPLGGEP